MFICNLKKINQFFSQTNSTPSSFGSLQLGVLDALELREGPGHGEVKLLSVLSYFFFAVVAFSLIPLNFFLLAIPFFSFSLSRELTLLCKFSVLLSPTSPPFRTEAARALSRWERGPMAAPVPGFPWPTGIVPLFSFSHCALLHSFFVFTYFFHHCRIILKS